uniref:Uncharacterized protein n=1 Tax=Erwinia amylovora ATCC BAA-2158 TaxID=889211 RepID=E5B826_ERWAM|nr:hypothetical protein predicted by Glimmer/Critica [Erwinia amylovora ATCC BAA-2158]
MRSRESLAHRNDSRPADDRQIVAGRVVDAIRFFLGQEEYFDY